MVEENSVFEGMLNDRITLVKMDGSVAKEDIRANVQAKMIFIDDASLPIETGDRLLRSLPSGLVDEFIVDDPGFKSGLHGLKSHFQTKLHRSDAPAAQPSTIINHIQGQNARVNINSTDNSQNVAVGGDCTEVLHALRQELEASQIPRHDAKKIRKAIDEMEEAETEASFKEGYVRFMAAAADHVAVFGPLLGALAAFL